LVEGYAADLGWAIGRGETYSDPNYQDQIESVALYDILEKQVVPLFYKRGVDNIPREWIGRMKNCLRRLAPVFNTNRMVKDYAEMFYIPAHVRGTRLAADSLARSVALARAKDNYRHKWNSIKIVGVHTTGSGHYKVGDELQVEAMLELDDLAPTGLAVQLYTGVMNAAGVIENPYVVPMQYARQVAAGRHLFSGTINCQASGRQGFAIRVLPGDPDMATPFEPGLIYWG
jgi:starch phosphorylase